MANSLAFWCRAGTTSTLHSDLHRVYPTERSPQRWPSAPVPRVPATGLLRILHLQTAPKSPFLNMQVEHNFHTFANRGWQNNHRGHRYRVKGKPSPVCTDWGEYNLTRTRYAFRRPKVIVSAPKSPADSTLNSSPCAMSSLATQWKGGREGTLSPLEQMKACPWSRNAPWSRKTPCASAVARHMEHAGTTCVRHMQVLAFWQ